MAIQTERIQVSSKGHADMIDLTPRLEQIVRDASMSGGIATVFVPGATAAISTVEYEPGLMKDIPKAMERLAPSGAAYHHDETWHDGNGHSHVRATVVGPSLTIPFENKTLSLGTWQQVVLLDFDNRSRRRDVVVQLMGE